jgi:hypothetical protein
MSRKRSTSIVVVTSSPRRRRPCGTFWWEQARRTKSAKRGGELKRIELHEKELAIAARGVDLIALDEALNKLACQDPRRAELVKLRYFAGLTIRQPPQALEIAESTADADWAYAKGWFRLELASPGNHARTG